MSQTELQRFAADVQATPALADRYRDIATPADLAVRLRADGYDVTDAEMEEVHRTGSKLAGTELSDEQLDDVSGGSLIVSAAATLFGLGVAGVLAGAIIGIVADSAKRGTLPKG